MSRIAKKPINIPDDIKIELNNNTIIISKNDIFLKYNFHKLVCVKYKKKFLYISIKKKNNNSWIQAGTTRSLINSMLIGVSLGFTKKLQLNGVGYKVLINENIITLFLGYSHSINYILPNGIKAICQNQNEIIIQGADKQLVGQVASKLRSYKKPEPYKGKGIRYIDEFIKIKEAKKK